VPVAPNPCFSRFPFGGTMPVCDAHRRQLQERGYVILENAVPARRVLQLRQRLLELFEEEGDRAGSEFLQEQGARRLANLVDKDEIFRWAVAKSTVLDYIACILGPEFKLSSSNARLVDPHNGVTQPLHVDMSALPDENGFWVANVVWMLDDFTPDNGATRAVPGSHRRGQRPQDVLDDPAAEHPEQVLITGPAGSLCVMNSHLWHGGTANRTDTPRLALHTFYCRRDKPQQQYQKQLLSEETQALLSPALRHLLALDDPLNDELSAAVAVRSGFMKG